jgi:hypothetical protein
MGAFCGELAALGIITGYRKSEKSVAMLKVSSTPIVGENYFSYMDNGDLVSITVIGVFKELVVIRTAQPHKCFSGMKSEFVYPIRNYNFYLKDTSAS